jgi:Stigma-specific protein, Stig1
MERLDELSKLLAGSVSRRESLRRIGGIFAGAALGSLGLRTAWAAGPDRCTSFCRSCPTKKRRNQCVAACKACNGNTSRLCGSCGAFTCCPAATMCCSGTCTSVSSDAQNCGACGYVCAGSTPICNQGTCGNCPPGYTVCSGVCVDLLDDRLNCGACGNVCPDGYGCGIGECQAPE